MTYRSLLTLLVVGASACVTPDDNSPADFTVSNKNPDLSTKGNADLTVTGNNPDLSVTGNNPDLSVTGNNPDLTTTSVSDLSSSLADLTTMTGDLANMPGVGPAPVVLGSSSNLATAGAYIMLAKTGITNVTGSKITGGALGVSPAAASTITGFALVADATNVFATSPSVVAPGKVYAANYALPTPTNLTAAVLSMQAAYSDAAGRLNPDHTNLNSGNLGGLTLAPGLYLWGNTVTIPTDVTLSGGANDTWIFQIAGDLDLSAAKNVILAGGAQTKNIVWQVAGKTTIHANSHFEGVILCKTAITLQTLASMNGRALAQTLVAIDNNAVTAP